MMEAVGSPETVVILHQTTRRHIREDNLLTVTATAPNLAQFYSNWKMYKVLNLCLLVLCTGTQELKISSLLVHQVYRNWEERRL
jgi:hypothetical protein